MQSIIREGSVHARPTLLLCNIHVFVFFLFSHLCLAWRGLWSEGDAPAEVPAPGERDPGTHSGGGRNPGELTARQIHVLKHTAPLPVRLGKGWYSPAIQPLSCCLCH